MSKYIRLFFNRKKKATSTMARAIEIVVCLQREAIIFIQGIMSLSTNGVTLISVKDYEHRVDVTSINDGVYIAAILTTNSVVYRKFLKKGYITPKYKSLYTTISKSTTLRLLLFFITQIEHIITKYIVHILI